MFLVFIGVLSLIGAALTIGGSLIGHGVGWVAVLYWAMVAGWMTLVGIRGYTRANTTSREAGAIVVLVVGLLATLAALYSTALALGEVTL